MAVAEQLLAHGADVELPDNYGQSPLFMACWKGTSLVGMKMSLNPVFPTWM